MAFALILPVLALPATFTMSRRIAKAMFGVNFLYMQLMQRESERNLREAINPVDLDETVREVQEKIKKGQFRDVVDENGRPKEQPWQRLSLFDVGEDLIREMQSVLIEYGRCERTSEEDVQELLKKARGTYCLFRAERYVLYKNIEDYFSGEPFPDQFSRFKRISQERIKDKRWGMTDQKV